MCGERVLAPNTEQGAVLSLGLSDSPESLLPPQPTLLVCVWGGSQETWVVLTPGGSLGTLGRVL